MADLCHCQCIKLNIQSLYNRALVWRTLSLVRSYLDSSLNAYTSYLDFVQSF